LLVATTRIRHLSLEPIDNFVVEADGYTRFPRWNGNNGASLSFRKVAMLSHGAVS
jgi:hypothetical protein